MFLLNRYLVLVIVGNGKGEGNIHPRNGREVPEGSTDIAILFL